MDPRSVKNHFQEQSTATVDMIRDLVDIESPSNDAAGSKAVVDLVVDLFNQTGVDCSFERIPVEGVGEHLIVRAFPDDAKPVLLLGHTDTVHPAGTKLKNSTRIEDDKLYGCGTFDMKANIALMIAAFRYFAETGTRPSRPITILLSCDEEVGSPSGRELVEREAVDSDHCLIFEPSAAGRVKTGRKGTGMYTVRAHGVPSHAGLDPEKGASAILELSHQIQKLHELNKPEIGTTVNVCTIEGGTTSNVIPEFAECSVDVRFTTIAEAERIDKAIKELLVFDERVSLEIKGGINRPPMERTEANIELYQKAHDLAASFDYELGETQVGGASDGNFVGALGVPVLDGLGISGDGAHRLDEHVLVSDIADRATLATLLLAG